MQPTVEERVIGCLKGIATGDAIGKQTENLSTADVTYWYPNGVSGFEGTPGDIIPRYVGNRKREWLVGETTDDTERTIAVARAIISHGTVSCRAVGREMLECRKSVHPGVESLWAFHEANDPNRVDHLEHDGCGAAIRVAPVGIVHSSCELPAIVTAAREASISTHGGSYAIAAAAANAAAVAGALDGASGSEIAGLAQRAAAVAEKRWPHADGPALASAFCRIRSDLASRSILEPDYIAARYAPTTPLTIAPLALALATVLDSAETAILLATNIGGDSDSVASIAGGILGARHPESINDEWFDVVEKLNRHDLEQIAISLSALRGLCGA